jgi:hypothetical protein
VAMALAASGATPARSRSHVSTVSLAADATEGMTASSGTAPTRFRVQGLELRVEGLGFRV